MTVALLLLGWLVGGTVLAVLLGRVIDLRDRRHRTFSNDVSHETRDNGRGLMWLGS